MRVLKALSIIGLMAGAMFGSSTSSGGNFTMSTTPAQFSTTLGHVQSITFRSVPGYCGKIYIGSSAMNTSTLAGVFKVIYPNCSGGIGDEYKLVDYTATDGIDSGMFYIAGGISGELLTWEAYQTGITASTQMTVYCSGPVTVYGNYSPSAPVCATASHAPMTNVTGIQVAVVPGMSGKIYVGGASMNPSGLVNMKKVLWPNSSGTPATDFWAFFDPLGGNNVWLPSYTTAADGASWGEYPLVTAWQRQ